MKDLNKKYLGMVLDSDDSTYSGRCKVKVFGLWDDYGVEELPWCYPKNSGTFGGGDSKGFGSFSYPKVGTMVDVYFENDLYHPYYTTICLSNSKMPTEIKDSYENCQVLTYDEDEDLKVLYTQKDGLMIWRKGSYFNILPSNDIKIFHEGGNTKIDMLSSDITEFSSGSHYVDSPEVKVGHSASHPAVKGDELFKLLKMMAKTIDAKTPQSPSVTETLVQTYKMSVLSNVVDIA